MKRSTSQVRAKDSDLPRQTAGVEWQPSSGTKHWLCFNDLEVLLLAQGLSTARMQMQAPTMARAIEPEEG